MALGDITATTTAYATMNLLNTALEALNSGGATAGADTTSFFITALDRVFYLTTIVRAAA
jgi:hypothetical protein